MFQGATYDAYAAMLVAILRRKTCLSLKLWAIWAMGLAARVGWFLAHVSLRMQAAGVDSDKTVTTKRLKQLSMFLSNKDQMTWAALFNAIAIPSDLLLQFMIDAASPDKAQDEPLFAKMVQHRGSPLYHTQVEHASLLEPGSDLSLVLDILTQREPEERREAFYNKWAVDSIKHVVHVSGGQFHRLDALYEQDPIPLFRMARHPNPDTRLKLGAVVFYRPECCKDRGLTVKVCSLASCPAQLTRGRIRECLAQAPHVLTTMTAHLERENAMNLHAGTSDKRKVSVERIRYENFIQQWSRDFQRRGGVVTTTLTRGHLRQAQQPLVRDASNTAPSMFTCRPIRTSMQDSGLSW